MGVEGELRPNILSKVREIGQTARLSSRSPGDFAKRGGWIWTTQLHLVRQARRCEGGFPVGRASRNSKGLCRKGTTGQLDISLIDRSIRQGTRNNKRLGSTTSPTTGNSHHLTSCGSFGPQQPIQLRRPKRQPRATSHHSARSPVLLFCTTSPSSSQPPIRT